MKESAKMTVLQHKKGLCECSKYWKEISHINCIDAKGTQYVCINAAYTESKYETRIHNHWYK